MNGHYKIPLAKGADPMADPRVKRLIASFDTGAQVRIDVREETLQLYKYRLDPIEMDVSGWLKMDTAPRYVEIVATGGNRRAMYDLHANRHTR